MYFSIDEWGRKVILCTQMFFFTIFDVEFELLCIALLNPLTKNDAKVLVTHLGFTYTRLFWFEMYLYFRNKTPIFNFIIKKKSRNEKKVKKVDNAEKQETANTKKQNVQEKL